MSRRNVELMKNTIILSIGQIVPKLIAIFVLPLLTTFLTKRDYGLYELTLSIASFLIPLLSVQIQQGVFRFLIEKERDKKEIITTSFLFIIIVFLLSSIPIVIAWNLYSKDLVLGVLFFISYFMEMLLGWAGQVTRGLGDNLQYSIAYIIYSIIYIAILISIFIITSELDVKKVAIAMIGAYLSAILFLYIKDHIWNFCGINSFNVGTLKLLLNFSAPMVISSISLWIVNLSDRFLVSGLLGIEMTAVYSVSNRIPNLFNSMYNIFNLAWTENTSRLSKYEKEKGYYSNFFRDFYRVMVGLMTALIAVSPLLFKILINSQYANGYWLMSWLFVGTFFSSMVSFFGSIYVGEKRTKDVGISSVVGAIINVAINMLFMKRFGVIIAAISTIISYFIIFMYRAIDIRRYINIHYNFFSIVFGIVVVIFIAAINCSFSVFTTVISVMICIAYNWLLNRKFYIMMLRNMLYKVRGKNVF